MTTVTGTIIRELLGAVDDPSGLEQIFQQYSRSRGPFYKGLAQATSQLRHQLDELRQETATASARHEHLQSEVAELEGQRQHIEEATQSLDQVLQQREVRLTEIKVVLDRAEELGRRGFGQEELGRLYELLAQIAAAQGEVPAAGVAEFFRTVESYEEIVALSLKAKRAEARVATAKSEAERWESEARLRESRSKARVFAVDVTERLLASGVKATDLPQWEKVLDRAGVTAEELAQTLEQYGSLKALTGALQAQVDALQSQASSLESQVNLLTQRRGNLQAAIQAVGDKALAEVRKMGQQVVRQFQAAGEQTQEYLEGLALAGAEYGRLREESAILREYVEVARALRSSDPVAWQALPRPVIQSLLVGIIRWAEMEGHNAQIPAPASVRKAQGLSSWTRLKLSEVLLWALTGALTEEERRALPGPS